MRASGEEGSEEPEPVLHTLALAAVPETVEAGEGSCSKCEEIEREEEAVCRFCLGQNVPTVTRDASFSRRATWATDSFLQNAVVPSILRVAKVRGLRSGTCVCPQQGKKRTQESCGLILTFAFVGLFSFSFLFAVLSVRFLSIYKAFRRRFRPKALQAAEDSSKPETGCGPNRMLTPCLCKGSQQFVHDKCLQYWISQRLARGLPLARALKCPVCQEQYSLPRDFHVGGAGRKMDKGPLRLLATAGEWYFSSWFLLGGVKGLGAAANSALQLAASPLCLFPGLPLNVFTQGKSHECV